MILVPRPLASTRKPLQLVSRLAISFSALLISSTAVTPDTEARRIAIFKDAKLRLLMTLVGFERLGIDDKPDATWIIPSAITARQLHETHDVIEKHRNDPVMEYGEEDPMTADEMLRRKPAEKVRRAAYDDDLSGDDGIVSDGNDDDLLFPARGPTDTGPRTAAAALEKLRQKRRRRRDKPTSDNEDGVGELDDETRELRRKAREAKDLKKREMFKSAEFVYDSDDDPEVDRLFFEREEMRRTGHAKKVMEVLKAGMVEGKGKRKNDDDKVKFKEKSKRRKVSSERESESESESDKDEDVRMAEDSLSPRIQELSDGTKSEGEDTPLSTPLDEVPQEKILRDIPINVRGSDDDSGRRKAVVFDRPDENGGGSEKEDEAFVVMPSRRRNRAAMVLESDSD